MAQSKVKILLDADVIIHFAKGDMLSILPSILPEFDFAVLDVVQAEVHQPTLGQLQCQMLFLNNIEEIKFGETSEERKEFLRLASGGLGRGESACMVYCRYHHDVVGSCNLKDIKEYCKEHQITYLTTIDFLYYGIQHKVITRKDAEEFIVKVNDLDSSLPLVDFDTYFCNKI